MKNKVIAIVLGGGEGKRFGLTKQFISIHNIPLFIYTLKKFKKYTIILTIPKKYMDIAQHNINSNNIKNVILISGGKTRQESCYLALSYIKSNINSCNKVIITDANRPCINSKTIKQCIKELDKHKAVITVCKSINTSCRSFNGKYLESPLDRTYQYDMLMPQAFDFKTLYNAHKTTKITNASDDSQLLYTHLPIKLVYASFWENLKLTYIEDYEIFEILLKKELK